MLLLGFIILIANMLGSAAVERKLGRVERRLAEVERKLDAIVDQLDVSLPEPELAEVRAFLLAGKEIQAIKAYREGTGADLKEAKDAVDRLSGQ